MSAGLYIYSVSRYVSKSSKGRCLHWSLQWNNYGGFYSCT